MSTPNQINKALYPFSSNYFETPHGRIHYVDTGEGEPIVMPHGNPVWSFLYRQFIKELSPSFRCIAVDNLGFGLSDKPKQCDFKPSMHAENLANLIDYLGLKNITLMGHDWAGPIGLSYALENPENVAKLILFNTWCWPVMDDPHFRKFSRFMGGKIGRFLILNFNFFVRVIMKKATVDKQKLAGEVLRHYELVLPDRASRQACAVLPKEILGSTEWLHSLWSQRERIASIPTRIFWGAKDIAFRDKELEIWRNLFKNCEVTVFDDAGHYPQEEKPEVIIPEIKKFLSSID
jgi:haloalkane dehalogenase